MWERRIRATIEKYPEIVADVSDAATVFDDSRSASILDEAVPAGPIDLTESIVDKLTRFFAGLSYDEILKYRSDPGKSPQRVFLVPGVKRMQQDYPELLSELEIPFGAKTQIIARILSGSLDLENKTVRYAGRWRKQVITTLRHFTTKDRAPLAPYVAELGLDEEIPGAPRVVLVRPTVGSPRRRKGHTAPRRKGRARRKGRIRSSLREESTETGTVGSLGVGKKE